MDSFLFFLFPLLAGLAASLTSGMIGTYVVVKRITFIAGSISHSVLGGMGLALFLRRTFEWEWLLPIYGALAAALLSAFFIATIHTKFRDREDTAIAALWSTGMALGVIFVALTPGYSVELMDFLFGNILWANKSDLIVLLVLAAAVLFTIFTFHKQLIALCFDEKQAKLQSVSTKWLYILLLTLIALTVVVLIQIVGAILVIAMLALPAAIAGTFVTRLSSMMVLATLLSALFTTIGMFLSYTLNWPPGATIALASACFYLLNFTRKQKKAA